MMYICPMHPEIKRDMPGICPECGMNLVPVAQDKHTGHKTESFLQKFWVSLVLSALIIFFNKSELIPLIFGSIIFFYGGRVFIASAYRELRAKLPGMMTLIALAISVSYAYSVAVTLFYEGEPLFWELATLITIMLLGHWLEMRAVSGAQNALKELSKLLPDQVEISRGKKIEIISISELKKDDLILVKPGGRIPADGIVKEGISDVNESIATGESKPVPKKAGEAVIAGTTNGDGSLKILVSKIGEETFLAGVMRLVAEAQRSKSRLQMLSDRAAFYLTIIAVITGGITFAVWLILADITFAINRMVAVLVIACPHALGLAIPLVASISTTKAARNGFLVKQRLALEAARNVDIVLFDKTGTLTRGEFGVYKVIGDVLQYAASVNSHSEHPLAKAIVDEAKKKGVEILEIKNFQRIPGKGVKAEINSDEILVGSSLFVEEFGEKLADDLKTETNLLEKQGQTINFVIKNKKVIGAIALADVIREESREAIQFLSDMGIKTAMITGDAEDVAKWVAEELKINEYFARVLPGEKSEKVKLLQSRGMKVAMVGDGVNDAPALTQADLGIAIGAGTNVAIESASIILVRNDPRDIPKIIHLSKFTYSKMIQNLFWATGYNVIAIPLAAGALASWGFFLQPAIAAVLMSASTVIVAFNAILLRGKKI